MKHILVCGFGNPYCRDDGIERAVVNKVREQLEKALLDSPDDGFNDLGRPIDTVVLHQSVPEMAETVVDYDLVIFVDVQVAAQPELLYEECITPAHQPAAFISHQTHPTTVLELAKKVYGRAPQAVMLSLHSHDFGKHLSRETATLVSLVVERILEWVQANPLGHKYNRLSPVQKDTPSTRCQLSSPKVY